MPSSQRAFALLRSELEKQNREFERALSLLARMPSNTEFLISGRLLREIDVACRATSVLSGEHSLVSHASSIRS